MRRGEYQTIDRLQAVQIGEELVNLRERNAARLALQERRQAAADAEHKARVAGWRRENALVDRMGRETAREEAS